MWYSTKTCRQSSQEPKHSTQCRHLFKINFRNVCKNYRKLQNKHWFHQSKGQLQSVDTIDAAAYM